MTNNQSVGMFITKPTSGSTLLEALNPEIAKDPWRVFTRYPSREARAKCLSWINGCDPREAPMRWIEQTVTCLAAARATADPFFEPLLAWYISAARDEEMAARAIKFAFSWVWKENAFARDHEAAILTAIVKKLDAERNGFPPSDLYWSVPGLHDYFEYLLWRLRTQGTGTSDDSVEGYLPETWSSALKALNQVAQEQDTSFSPILDKLDDLYAAGAMKPRIENGPAYRNPESNADADTFKPFVLLDHPAIIHARANHLGKLAELQRWHPAFLNERIEALGVTKGHYSVDLILNPPNLVVKAGTPATVRLQVTVPDPREAELVRRCMDEVCVRVKAEGLTFAPDEAARVHVSDNAWEWHLFPAHGVGRLTLYFSDDPNVSLPFVPWGEKKAIYIKGE